MPWLRSALLLPSAIAEWQHTLNRSEMLKGLHSVTTVDFFFYFHVLKAGGKENRDGKRIN